MECVWGMDMLFNKKIIGTVAYLGGIPFVPEKFCWSFSQMVQYNTEFVCAPGEIINYDRAQASYHVYARNSIADNIKGDWLLMLDADHSFDPDILARMLFLMNKHNIQVLTGLYQYKGSPHAPVIYKFTNDEKLFDIIGDWDKSVELFQIDSAGAGCLLIKREVLNKIRLELKESPFDIIHPYSEDHSFFMRLKKIGVQAYCAPNIESHHLVMKELELNDYEKEGLEFSDKKQVNGFK